MLNTTRVLGVLLLFKDVYSITNHLNFQIMSKLDKPKNNNRTISSESDSFQSIHARIKATDLKKNIIVITISNSIDRGDHVPLMEQVKSFDGADGFTTNFGLTLPNLVGVIAPFCLLLPSLPLVYLGVQETEEEYLEEINNNFKLVPMEGVP